MFFPLLTYALTVKDQTGKTLLLPTHGSIVDVVLMFVCLFEETMINLLCAVSNHSQELGFNMYYCWNQTIFKVPSNPCHSMILCSLK